MHNNYRRFSGLVAKSICKTCLSVARFSSLCGWDSSSSLGRRDDAQFHYCHLDKAGWSRLAAVCAGALGEERERREREQPQKCPQGEIHHKRQQQQHFVLPGLDDNKICSCALSHGEREREMALFRAHWLNFVTMGRAVLHRERHAGTLTHMPLTHNWCCRCCCHLSRRGRPWSPRPRPRRCCCSCPRLPSPGSRLIPLLSQMISFLASLLLAPIIRSQMCLSHSYRSLSPRPITGH